MGHSRLFYQTEEVKEASKTLCLKGRFLKEMALEITPAITYLFNKSLELGRVPKDWLDAHIVPIFKKGDKNTPVMDTK
jgi:hypothetical protein